MYNHADKQEDKEKSYIELDSTETEIIKYLNDNYKDVILLVKSSAAMELDWLKQYPNIKAVVYSQNVTNALAKVFSGEVNPSGRTVDTFAADALASPAAQNFGSYQYYDENGKATKYNYVDYAEGIYVGYKYYETRYEDKVLGQGNAGDYDYAKEVVYPFGYGLSYTDFKWSDFSVARHGNDFVATVTVTNTGDTAGKDVVELYAQSPYTDYDKRNAVEKASVNLVGYGKTSELKPGTIETVRITFGKDQLKAYDYKGAKTYILDAGQYRFTAATDANQAVNNILADKGKTVADGMTSEGDRPWWPAGHRRTLMWTPLHSPPTPPPARPSPTCSMRLPIRKWPICPVPIGLVPSRSITANPPVRSIPGTMRLIARTPTVITRPARGRRPLPPNSSNSLKETTPAPPSTRTPSWIRRHSARRTG